MPFSDTFVDDLDVLDYLELLHSTTAVARGLGISQSSCSRRYRAFSQQFDLGFDRVDGRYGGSRNGDVLSSLRRAAQIRRVRAGQYRFGVGWQLASLFQPDPASAARCLPLRQMDSWGVASLLEQRLVDFWLGGLLEFAQLLPQPFNSLRSKRLALTQTVMCVPICRWTLQLFAHRNHPLRQAGALTPVQFRRYPSPSLPVGMAPLLIRQLQDNGLATSPSRLRGYAWGDWHGAAADGHSLSYGGPHDGVKAAADGIEPLAYPLKIVEVGALLGHRDVIEDGQFETNFKQLSRQLRHSPGANQDGLHWLI
jgi:hypothetical protein